MMVEKQLKMCWFNLSVIPKYANGKAYINHGRKTPNPYCFLQLLSLAIKLIQPGEDKAQERSHECVYIPEGRVQKRRSRALFIGARCQEKRHWVQIGTQAVPSEQGGLLQVTSRDSFQP